MTFFDRVVGGEPALPPDQAVLWDDPVQDGPVADLCRLYAGPEARALWLGSGRAVLGAALSLIGDDARRGVAAPEYQCAAVFDKIARRWPLRPYPLGADLLPCLADLAALAPGVVVTTLYFGSPRLRDGLAALAPALWGLPGRPWIIEDRVLCVPEPGPFPPGRDFILYSFRKSYPVPDGALLIAVSERARALMPAAQPVGPASAAVRAKVAAKVARWRWLSQRPCPDDSSVNGLDACVQSERMIDKAADCDDLDFATGSAGSARWLLGRDAGADLATARRCATAIIDAAQARWGKEGIGLSDAVGPGVPVLVPQRAAVRSQAARRGIFLPVHWPRAGDFPLGVTAARWYGNELTFPSGPMHSADDWTAVSTFLSTLDV